MISHMCIYLCRWRAAHLDEVRSAFCYELIVRRQQNIRWEARRNFCIHNKKKWTWKGTVWLSTSLTATNLINSVNGGPPDILIIQKPFGSKFSTMILFRYLVPWCVCNAWNRRFYVEQDDTSFWPSSTISTELAIFMSWRWKVWTHQV